VADGRILPDSLQLTGWSEAKLKKEIAKRHLRLSDIFILTVDDCGSVTVIKKSL